MFWVSGFSMNSWRRCSLALLPCKQAHKTGLQGSMDRIIFQENMKRLRSPGINALPLDTSSATL